MLVLSVTPEGPTTQGHTEPAPTVVASGQEEGQAEAAKPSADAVPQRTLVGKYRNLAEHREGQVHLEVQGNAVYAALQTVRSPVQYFARQQPEVLFTIPAGFRPAVPITWEVNGQHVGADGQLDPGRRDLQVFRLRVDTEGHVRYVDDRGVDDVGYLRYHTALAWPLAGTDSQVCERSREFRSLILSALDDLIEESLSCDQIDWDHLGQLSALPFSRHVAVRARDLLGLTNLTVLKVHAGDRVTLSGSLLAFTPRLHQLSLETRNPITLPPDLLHYTPQLQSLSLTLRAHTVRDDLVVSEDLLSPVPHLVSLQWRNYFRPSRFSGSLEKLLFHTPQLTDLTVDSRNVPLPGDLLFYLPRLKQLRVDSGLDLCRTPDFLAPVTPLTHLTLRLEGIDQLRCLSRSLQQRNPDLAQLRVELEGLQGLTDELVPGLPHLTHLTLDVARVNMLPPRLLSQFPNLVSLQLHDSNYSRHRVASPLALPETFFAHTPNLTDLSLRTGRMTRLAPNLLAPVPNLQQLELTVSAEGSLPVDLLAPVPELGKFSVSVENSDAMPMGFLDDLAQLTELSIQFRNYDKYDPGSPLPEDFQIVAPKLEKFSLHSNQPSLPDNILLDTANLTHLHLNVPNLQEWPAAFLMQTPALEFLEMKYGYNKGGKEIHELRSVPPHFLVRAPNLIHLNLGAVDRVQELPAGFLANSPKLEYLDLAVNVAELPENFLAQHPQLKTVKLFASRATKVPPDFLAHVLHLQSLELDLRQVDALPADFLARTPWLGYLRLDVDQVDALPSSFLSYTPRLGHLYMRAANVESLPENFLDHSPRIKTLGLGMPHLASPPGPGDALWDTLQTTSFRVKVTEPEVHVEADGYFCSGDVKVVKQGDILEVFWREQDSMGNTVLSVFHWWNRDLFFSFYERHWCLFSIDARYTEPTVEL